MLKAALLAAFIGCQAFDATTTSIGLSRGYREANTLMPQSRGLSLTVKASYTFGGGWLYWSQRHRKFAWVIPSAGASAGCFAGAWNWQQLRKSS